MRCAILIAAVLVGAGLAMPADTRAGDAAASAAASDAPPDLAAVQALDPAEGPDIPFAEDKRRAAVRLAALGFGSRAGLARRAWEIAGLLDRHAARLTAIYRFGDLMLREGGFEMLPPVVAETRRASRLERAGTRAARAERVLRIVEPARLVSAAPGWRDWLDRSWPEVAPPASVLFPRDREERGRWRRLIAEGWAEGRALADDIFAADLDRLNRTFEGVVLWHRLRRTAMVTAPVIEVVVTDVSGHERLVRIGETAGRIVRSASFELDAARWAPAAGSAP